MTVLLNEVLAQARAIRPGVIVAFKTSATRVRGRPRRNTLAIFYVFIFYFIRKEGDILLFYRSPS